MMALPIKKKINTELFNRKAAIYKVDGQVKNVVRVVNIWYWLISRSSIPFAESTKRCGDE